MKNVENGEPFNSWGANNIEAVTFTIAGAGPTATHHLYSIYSNYSLVFRYILFIFHIL
ncbi:MAG TPA: hypothetical protein VE445_10290 [Nitrososphaeraceae archaeon]|nr:hypothetical protein [Nitrososphaeraceae archaeon]